MKLYLITEIEPTYGGQKLIAVCDSIDKAEKYKAEAEHRYIKEINVNEKIN